MKRESGSQSLKSRNTNVHLFDVRLLRAFHALGSVFATLENTIIIFLSPPPPPPPKKKLQSFQEKLKTIVMQNLGGGRDRKTIIVFSKVANPRCSLEIRLAHSLVCFC